MIAKMFSETLLNDHAEPHFYSRLEFYVLFELSRQGKHEQPKEKL